MNIPSHIIVGSTNPAKVQAVHNIAERIAPTARIVTVNVPSGVSEQPIGIAETRTGAIARARAAVQKSETSDAESWGIGLEGGVIFGDDGTTWLCNVAAVATAAGDTYWGEGARLLLPPSVGTRLRAGEELGPIMDDISGVIASKTKGGAIGFLTGGLVTRVEMWQVALACGLAPLIQADFYTSATNAGEVAL